MYFFKMLPEVCPEDGLVVRGVDVLILVLNVTDAYPVALSGTRDIAVHQFIDLLSTVSPVFSVHQHFTSKSASSLNNGSLLWTVDCGLWGW